MAQFDRVRDVLARVMEVPPAEVTPASQQAEFARWDSIRHLDLVMEIEAEFGCTLSMREATALRSVPDILRVLGTKAAA